MKFKINLDFNEFIDYHTLLYGETNTGKTYQTSKFIQFLLESKKIPPKDITILDFAPPLSRIDNREIGGKIQDFYKSSIKCKNILFEGEIIPPRLKAKNKGEIYKNACENLKKTSKILNKFIEVPSPVLIINDISIYLHIGNKITLMNAIKKSTTFFGNSYYGSSIKSNYPTLISLREIRLVKYLIKKLDKSYFTR
jgi:hypothetical protein